MAALLFRTNVFQAKRGLATRFALYTNGKSPIQKLFLDKLKEFNTKSKAGQVSMTPEVAKQHGTRMRQRDWGECIEQTKKTCHSSRCSSSNSILLASKDKSPLCRWVSEWYIAILIDIFYSQLFSFSYSILTQVGWYCGLNGRTLCLVPSFWEHVHTYYMLTATHPFVLSIAHFLYTKIWYDTIIEYPWGLCKWLSCLNQGLLLLVVILIKHQVVVTSANLAKYFNHNFEKAYLAFLKSFYRTFLESSWPILYWCRGYYRSLCDKRQSWSLGVVYMCMRPGHS